MNKKEKVDLYGRLPEIYRIRDAEQQPQYQLKNYLALVEEAFAEIKGNIESLYNDHFIDTCDDWVIPYIGDLLGTSHLSGDPWTLRADVADTIALRRRKGTLGAIERLTYDLTEWGVHCSELRENLLWTQNLNHQRPDAGGKPPYGLPSMNIHTPIRGGTVTLRDPEILSLLRTPFDPFAHVVDLKPPVVDGIRYNLPNLAVFLWRLRTCHVGVSKPLVDIIPTNSKGNNAKYLAHVTIHPSGNLVKLYNKQKFQSNYATLKQINPLSTIEEEPIQIPRAFLNKYPVVMASKFHEDILNKYSPSGNPDAYVTISTYDDNKETPIFVENDTSLQIYFPASAFPDWSNDTVRIRGENLLKWEECLNPPLQNKEIAIDPLLGRMIVGVNNKNQANKIKKLLLSYTYATCGSSAGTIGANPHTTNLLPENAEIFEVSYFDPSKSLENILQKVLAAKTPVAAIRITDSMTHKLDLRHIIHSGNSILLDKTLYIQAGEGKRPVIKLAVPLGFRPKVIGSGEEGSGDTIPNLAVHLEGLYITRDENFEGTVLIGQAALNRLEIVNCTLDPGGNLQDDRKRSPIKNSINLTNDYGLDTNDAEAFKKYTNTTVYIRRTITGPLFISNDYGLFLIDSIVDAGSGINVSAENAGFALSGCMKPELQSDSWGPPTQVRGVTVLGRMRVESINGRGGIWVHSLEANNNQKGCIKFSYFASSGNRLPQNFACVSGDMTKLEFESECFGEPDYCQLARTTDFQVLERGPNDDAMGATGFLLEAHAWKNIQIRYREFMPVGVRSLLIPVPVMEF